MILVVIAVVVTILVPGFALAVPTLQTYINGATAGDYGSDEDTWWYSGGGPFSLYVVGAYGPNTLSLAGVTLLISVPNGETGTISFTTSDEQPVLLTSVGQGSASETNPTRDADTHILTDVTGYNGYATINDPTFLPVGLNLNNHYPLQDGVSDFIIFDLGSFDKSESNLNDYNAENGIIDSTTTSGEQKEYSVTVNGFTWVHFDAYGLETDSHGKNLVSTWENNPGSHDSTAHQVPEPEILMLLSPSLAGIFLYTWRRRKG